MLRDGNWMNLHGKGCMPRRLLLGVTACAVLWADLSASTGQELPSGGGPVPTVRRGANGQIEVVPPNATAPPVIGQRSATPAVTPKPARPEAILHRALPAVHSTAPPPRQPLIMVAPIKPRVPDTAPRGAVVATYSVKMSDGSPFTGTVRFGAPYYDDNGVFALSGNRIIVNPDGPGIGPNRTTLTDHITLEAIP